MEFWRTNAEYSVLQTLEQLKNERHEMNEDFELMIDHDTVRILVQKLKETVSLEEISLNCRFLARFLLNESGLSFSLKPINKVPLVDGQDVRQAILTKTARQLGKNKSSHFYMKQRLKETGSLRFYSRQESSSFVSFNDLSLAPITSYKILHRSDVLFVSSTGSTSSQTGTTTIPQAPPPGNTSPTTTGVGNSVLSFSLTMQQITYAAAITGVIT